MSPHLFIQRLYGGTKGEMRVEKKVSTPWGQVVKNVLHPNKRP